MMKLSDMYKLGLGAEPFGEVDRQRKRSALNAVIIDLEDAIQSANNAKSQLPNLLSGESANALSAALERQASQLRSSLSAVNNILRGV